MSCRTASVTRHTDETKIKVHLAIDGSGGSEVDSGIRMFDHFLT
ncbi:MAG: imidazoleglycerol-phosphate dehydratase, partial [Dehalococcoidia bacterium]